MMMLVASTAPDRPAARAKGTVRPSDMPITMSRTVSEAVKCLSTCGVCGMATSCLLKGPGGPSLLPPLQKLLEDHGAVPLLVPGGVDESDGPLVGDVPEQGQHVAPALPLRPIPLAEMRPPGRVVAVPLAQFCAGGEGLQPEVDPRLLLAHATGPQPLHQDPQAVVLRRRFVSPLQLNHAWFSTPRTRPPENVPGQGRSQVRGYSTRLPT